MYKISVYAISKNESKFVDRWYESVKEADEIYVLDTGSDDDTVEKLMNKGVSVTSSNIYPFRFDVARNMSLGLVSEDTDICVCLDFDEVIVSGWRKILESVWSINTTRLKYNYSNNGVFINMERIHKRYGYKWIHPVYETLLYDGCEVITTSNLIVSHYPDVTKNRDNYLELLELSVKEDSCYMYYLGREYMYHGRWNDCIDTLIEYLKYGKIQRCSSMRFIAKSYVNLNRYDEARMWLDKAIDEDSYCDSFVERAILEYKLGNWNDVVLYCNKAIENGFNISMIYDLLSLSFFYNGINKAIFYIDKAIQINPHNDRLLKNKEIFVNVLHNRQ